MEVLIELLLLIGGVTVAGALLPLQPKVRLVLSFCGLVLVTVGGALFAFVTYPGEALLSLGAGAGTLAIGGAIVKAAFRPAVLTDVKPGDDVMVTVELIDTRVGAVTGAVTAVDPASGAATVNTPGGPWTNTFLSGAVAGIKPGDQAILKLDRLDLGPSVLPPSMPSPGQLNPRGGGPTR